MRRRDEIGDEVSAGRRPVSRTPRRAAVAVQRSRSKTSKMIEVIRARLILYTWPGGVSGTRQFPEKPGRRRYLPELAIWPLLVPQSGRHLINLKRYSLIHRVLGDERRANGSFMGVSYWSSVVSAVVETLNVTRDLSSSGL